jgi:hypothetical protein
VLVAILSVFFWVFTVAIPEYCVVVWEDSNSLGTPSMGMLIMLISALPVLFLLPFFLIYLLQFLGRVLVSSAKGEIVPPRPPDRNFDGFFSGLTPWLVWFVLGLLPPLALAYLMDPAFAANPLLLLVLSLLGIPYATTALMMSFFHDRPFAATPWGVTVALAKHGFILFPTLLRVGVLTGLTALSCAFAFLLRASHFWLYLIMLLCWWGIGIWISIVEMRVLGVCYASHKDRLDWQSDHPRWGPAWRQ